MLDLIIRGGDVVTPQGVAKCDVGIKGETIAAVAAPGTLEDSNAARVIDADGQDRHARRHRSARAHGASVMTPDGKTLFTQGPTGSAWRRCTAAPPR